MELTLDRTIFWKNDSRPVVGIGANRDPHHDVEGSLERPSLERLDLGSSPELPSSGLGRRLTPSELHSTAPTCTIRGVLQIRNMSKDEIPQAKVFVMREETLAVRKDRKNHRRTNICRVRSLKWGPILPQSEFTRQLAIPVNFEGHPPSVQTGSLSFRYFVQLEADVAMYQRNPTAKVDFMLVEGTQEGDTGGSGVEGGGGEERGRGTNGYGMMSATD